MIQHPETMPAALAEMAKRMSSGEFSKQNRALGPKANSFLVLRGLKLRELWGLRACAARLVMPYRNPTGGTLSSSSGSIDSFPVSLNESLASRTYRAS